MSLGLDPARPEDRNQVEVWQRLDPRTLLVAPVRAARHVLLPLIVSFFGLTASQGEPPLWLIPLMVLVPCVGGAWPWLVTRYRLTETRLEVHKGLLNRRTLTAPLDRVRSVDFEQNFLHQLLGLVEVKIGTGVDDSRIELNALRMPAAKQLRAVLLAGQAPEPDTEQPQATDEPPRSASISGPQVLAEIDWSWLRYAPLNFTRLVIVGAAIGGLFQLRPSFITEERVDSTAHAILSIAIPLLVVIGVSLGIIAWLMVTLTSYLLNWWNLKVTRSNGTIAMSHGLFNTRSISVEEQRVRGVQLSQPLLVRAFRGADLSIWATGVGSGGKPKILPYCPHRVAVEVGGKVIEDAAPMRISLVKHGFRARRRCYFECFDALSGLVVIAAILTAVFDLPWWPTILLGVLGSLAAVGVAESAYSNLGHALTREHLVVGNGVLTRHRIALQRDGIIGWTLHQTWFQRRLDLATLTCTTSAGVEKVVINDIPLHLAVPLMIEATPGLIDQWRALDTDTPHSVH